MQNPSSEEQYISDRNLYQKARRGHALYRNNIKNAIYCATFTNKKLYIGQTSRTVHQRVKGHYNTAFSKCETIFHRALRKEPFDCIWSILEIVDITKYSLNDREKYWIAHYKSSDIDYGYNGTTGGEGCKVTSERFKERLRRHNEDRSWRTPEVIRKISESNTGNPFYQTEEFRETMSKATKGKKNGMFGKTHSKEALEKMTGRETKPEVVELIRNRGKSYAGDRNPFHGKTHDSETNARISAATSKGEVIDDKGNSYPSVFAASKALGIAESAVNKKITTGEFTRKLAVKPKVIDDKGNVYNSLFEAAKAVGRSDVWIRKRIRDGIWRYG
jgi:group I intron endonuclease